MDRVAARKFRRTVTVQGRDGMRFPGGRRGGACRCRDTHMGEDGRRGTLERALLSVLNQEGVAARPVVVITGGRPDPAAELASSYRAKVHIVGEPASPGRALGIGRKLTDARFYAFLDDDDELLPHALGTRLGIMRAEPAVDVVVTTGYWLSGGQRRIHIPDITAIRTTR